jgi:DNA-binding NarL/FixJ family response regulator
MFVCAVLPRFFMAHFVDDDESLMTRLAPLSIAREAVLEMAANGMTSNDIGSKLGITERTRTTTSTT